MKDYSFWIIDHKDFPDGWHEDLTLTQITTITETITGLGLESVMLEPFKNIHFCGDDLRARVEKSNSTLETLYLSLCRHNACTSSYDEVYRSIHWEVYVDWKPETHRVEFRETTNDVKKVLEWIFKIIWPGCTFPYIPSALVPPRITKEYPGLE